MTLCVALRELHYSPLGRNCAGSYGNELIARRRSLARIPMQLLLQKIAFLPFALLSFSFMHSFRVFFPLQTIKSTSGRQLFDDVTHFVANSLNSLVRRVPHVRITKWAERITVHAHFAMKAVGFPPSYNESLSVFVSDIRPVIEPW